MTFSIENKHKKWLWLAVVLIVLLLALCLINVCLGASAISIRSVINGNPTAQTIFLYVRLPRVIACIFVGSALSLSGLLLQATLNNSLASPGIIGINSGAGLAVVISSLLSGGSASAKPIAAFLGALLTCILVYTIARFSGASRSTLILAGIAISSLFSAIIDGIILLFPNALNDRTAFSIGSFSSVSITSIRFAAPCILLSVFAAIFLARYLDILILGDDVAASLGLHVRRCRFFAIILSATLAAGAVSIAGLLNFLGLIVPHLLRKAIGVSDYRRLSMLTVLAGAVFTLFCDLLARTLFAPFEVPVGILLSVLGVPFFLFLLFGNTRRIRYDAN